MIRIPTSIAWVWLVAWAPAQTPWLIESRETLPALNEQTRDLAAGDVDGDGFVDLLVVNEYYGTLAANRLYRNDGYGGFVEDSGAIAVLPTPGTWGNGNFGALLADLDGDGDLDAMIARHWTTNLIFVNDGTGVFTPEPQRIPQHVDATTAIEAADLDGDGDVDLFVGNWGQCRVYLNDGTGFFADATANVPPTNGRTEEVALADVDGDGDVDAVLASRSNMQNVLLRNDGSGRFTDATAQLPAALDETHALAAADLDGDGDVDLYFANSWQPDRLCLNDGGGTFVDASTQLPPSSGPSHGVAIGDVDGDGSPDVYLAGGGLSGSRNRLFLNDGRGRFTDATARTPSLVSQTAAVLLVDVDGDRDLDAVLGDGEWHPLPVRVHVNVGRHLTWSQPPVIGGTAQFDVFGPALGAFDLYASDDRRPLDLEPFGTLFLSPSHLIHVVRGTLDVQGRGAHDLFVPPSARGLTLHWQALVGRSSPPSWHLTNPQVARL